MRAQVRRFSGMKPVMSADLLAAGEAQYAIDVRLSGYDIKPLNGVTLALALAAGPQVKSIYRFGQTLVSSTQYWFQSTADVDYVKGPIDNDTSERTFWTDGVFPKKTDATIATAAAPYPSASYAMGIPFPPAAPTLAVSGVANNTSDPGEAVNYVMTYVSVWGEEGPPSLASNTVTWRAGQTLNLTGLSVAPGVGAHGENYNISTKRLYRAATGTQGTQFQLVPGASALAVAATTYNDTALTATLADVLATTGFIEPQYNMVGLCAGPNGMLAGFSGSTVMFSQPFTPYAWPARYQQSTDAPIVGMAWFDQTLFVGTTQGIYLFTGADPANMTSLKLAVAQSVASKRSVVSMLGGVIFASPDGLFRIDASGVVNLTDASMSRANWQAYVPSSINAYESDNRYVAFFDTGTRKAGMVFTFGAEPTFVETSLYAYGGFRDRKQDTLFIVPDTANSISKFDVGSPMTYTWTSGVFHLQADECMACAMVDAMSYPMTFQFYADGALMFTQSVQNSNAFRLPSGYHSKRIHFTLTGTGIVRDVRIATSMQEMGLP